MSTRYPTPEPLDRRWIDRRRRRLVGWLAVGLGLLVVGVCGVQAEDAPTAATDPWGDPLASERFQTWGLEDGLTERRVYDLAQDRQGFLWGATQNGLNRFDGQQFVAFQHDPEDGTSLGDNYILSVFPDDEGIVWVGTASGFERFDPETGTATHFLPDPEDPGSLPGAPVRRIRPRRAGGLWLVTGSGLVHFDPQLQRFFPVSLGAASTEVGAVDALEIGSGELWVATFEGVLHLSPDGELLDQWPLTIGSPGGLLRDHRGVVWVTSPEGPVRLRHGQPPELMPLAPEGSPARYTFDLFEDSEHRLWVATIGGVFVLDADRRLVRHLRHHPGERDSLRADLVVRLAEDRFGGVWLGSNDGLNRFDPVGEAFRVYRHQPGNLSSLSPTTVLALHPSQDGGLWVGHQGGGLDHLDFTGRVQHFRHREDDPGSLSHSVVWAVIEDSRGDLWVGTDAGLDYRPVGAERFRRIPLGLEEGEEQRVRVLTLLEGRAGDLWVGAGGSLVHCVGERCSVVDRYDVEALILALVEAPGGVLWVGSDHGGLHRLDLQANTLETWLHRPGDPSSLAHNVVGALHLDDDGVLWVGTSSGLQRLGPGDELERIDLGEPGPVKGILAHGDDLWLSTHRELVRFRPSTGALERLGATQGLPASYTYKAASRGLDGTLYFAGAEVVGVSPERLERDLSAPGVALTGVWVGEELVPLRQVETVGSELRYQEVKVGYRASSFSAELATLHFAAPQLNRSAYLLEGFDSEWVEVAAGQRRIRYTNLDPGRYLLRARGRSPSGVWSREVATLAVVVEAPPWRTPWAYAAYGLLVLGLVWRVVTTQRRKVRDLRERVATQLELLQAGRDLERVSAERGRLVVELEARRDELTVLQRTLSHDLRNPLTTIANFVGLLRRSTTPDDSRTRDSLDRIDRATRALDRLLVGMLEYSQLADSGEAAHRVDWGNLFRYTCERVAAGAPEHRVAVEIDDSLPVSLGDPERLRIVAQALIENAFQFTRQTPEPRITIRHQQGEEASRITVADNGPGIEVEYHERVFELFEQLESSTPGAGVGLAMAKRILEDAGGRIWIEPRLPEEPGCAVTFEIATTESATD